MFSTADSHNILRNTDLIAFSTFLSVLEYFHVSTVVLQGKY